MFTTLRSWLKSSPKSPSRTFPPRRRPLGIEALEERATPVANLLLTNANLSSVAVFAPGQSLTVQFSTMNLGTSAAGNWTDRIALSADTTFGAGDVVLGSGNHANGLGSMSGYAGSIAGAVPAGTTAGIRQVLVTTDSGNAVAESSELDNTRALPIVVLPSAVATPVRSLVGQLQTALGAALNPTAVSQLAGGATSITFSPKLGSEYRIGGYRVTELQSQVTVSKD